MAPDTPWATLIFSLSLQVGTKASDRWPGFVTKWRDGQIIPEVAAGARFESSHGIDGAHSSVFLEPGAVLEVVLARRLGGTGQ